MNNNKHAAIYCRISTENQMNNWFGLLAQIEQCTKEAQNLGYIVKPGHIFQDTWSSKASLDKRPWLMGLLKAVGDRWNMEWEGVDAVIMINLERLTRDKGEYLLLKDYLGNFSAKIVSMNQRDIEVIESEIKDDIVDFIISELLK